MTKIPCAPDRDSVKPGMAHLEGSGPAGKTCEHCAHRGYFRTGKSKFNQHAGAIEQNPVRTMGCRMFLKLTTDTAPRSTRTGVRAAISSRGNHNPLKDNQAMELDLEKASAVQSLEVIPTSALVELSGRRSPQAISVLTGF